jgi:Cu-Zn family superoxide dismutase
MKAQTCILAAGLAAGLAGAAPAQDGAVMANLKTVEGEAVGTARFQPTRSGILVVVELENVSPGEHGIHVHQTAECSGDFSSAGEHLAPDGHEHGFVATEAPHAGDLPNIVVNADGTGSAHFVNWRLTMEDLMDADGSALILHETSDTYMDPDSAGDPIACGTVDQVS